METKQLQHLHILVKADIIEPKALDLDGLKVWTEKTVRDQGLEPVIGPNVVYVDDPGNEGPTGSVNIKTSHMAFHIWDELGQIQADLYTCGPLDRWRFIDAFNVFKPLSLSYMVIDRAKGFEILEVSTELYHPFDWED